MQFTSSTTHQTRAIKMVFKLIFCVILIALLNVNSVRAESKGSGGGAKSDGSGESANAAESNQSDREWAKRTTKLNIYETKMRELNKKIQQMIKAKNNGAAVIDEKGNPIDALETISTSFSELKKTVKDYNAERDELKYKYPEEGARIERRYVPLREQSIEQIEKELSLDGDLTRTKRKIDKKYAPFMGDDLPEPLPRKQQTAESTLKEVKHKQHKGAGGVSADAHTNVDAGTDTDKKPKRLKLIK